MVYCNCTDYEYQLTSFHRLCNNKFLEAIPSSVHITGSGLPLLAYSPSAKMSHSCESASHTATLPPPRCPCFTILLVHSSVDWYVLQGFKYRNLGEWKTARLKYWRWVISPRCWRPPAKGWQTARGWGGALSLAPPPPKKSSGMIGSLWCNLVHILTLSYLVHILTRGMRNTHAACILRFVACGMRQGRILICYAIFSLFGTDLPSRASLSVCVAMFTIANWTHGSIIIAMAYHLICRKKLRKRKCGWWVHNILKRREEQRAYQGVLNGV